jgi:anti-anti-sigma regulatory factor
MTEHLHLPSELSIYSVGELHAEWMARWAPDRDPPRAGEQILVGADRVDEIDAAGVQLLLSLRRFVVSHGATLCLVDPSATLAAGCAALGAAVLLAQSPLAETTS